MEVTKTKDLIKLIKFAKEPAAFYLDYLSGNKCKHILWRYEDYTNMLVKLPYDLEEKGFFKNDKGEFESILIESVEICMNLLDEHRFIKVCAAERKLLD